MQPCRPGLLTSHARPPASERWGGCSGPRNLEQPNQPWQEPHLFSQEVFLPTTPYWLSFSWAPALLRAGGCCITRHRNVPLHHLSAMTSAQVTTTLNTDKETLMVFSEAFWGWNMVLTNVSNYLNVIHVLFCFFFFKEHRLTHGFYQHKEFLTT